MPAGIMALSKGSRWGAPYWAQIGFLFQRSLKVRRFETMQFLDFLQFVSIGLLCGERPPPQYVCQAFHNDTDH